MRRILLSLLVVTAFAPVAHAQNKKPVLPADMRTFQTPYYIMHTDLDDEGAREAYIRMTKMFEEYKRRTAGFSGDIREKFPFYLFKDSKDYYAAGAPSGSAGVFMRDMSGARLMAIAGEKTTRTTWHVVQHEGFHQFAAAVIRGDLPPWVNEGLAEYFGESIFTGDGFVTGVAPPNRVRRIQAQIKDEKFKSFRDMLVLTQKEWNDGLAMSNYDQAWAMTHFLAHGENNRYQKHFVTFMNQLGKGRPYTEAFVDVFGRDVDAFEKRFKDWWLAQPLSLTQHLADRAVVQTLTSYLARGQASGQTFADAPAFFKAAEAGEIKVSKDDWLPPALLAQALKDSAKYREEFELSVQKGRLPQLIRTEADGTKYRGVFDLNGARVRSATCEIVEPVPATTQKAK